MGIDSSDNRVFAGMTPLKTDIFKVGAAFSLWLLSSSVARLS
ncbi:hypothetical protein [Desulfovibrio sp.]|nr:hypothetical protein [Desulfovibrio sp.]